MYETDTNTTALVEEDDTLLPDGYAEGDDFFNEDAWSGAEQPADEPAADPAPAPESETGAEEAPEAAPTPEPAEEPGVSGEDSGAAPTPESAPEAEPRKLKFTARVDRADLDVEVDESELPILYQKAQVVDRVQARLTRLTPQLEKAEQLARSMGYDSMDAMLASAADNYLNTEVARLVADGVHEEVAKDIVQRRMADRTSTAAPAQETDAPADDSPLPPAAEPEERDFRAEVAELLRIRPELSGQKLPAEVTQDCVANRVPLPVAYARYEERQAKAENERLSKRIKVLEQNAASAARAPVSGVTGGGPTDTEPQDPFLIGFNADY